MTPCVLAIGSHKGGTGRTTTALALAALLGRLGHRVILVDPDPNHTAVRIACASGRPCTWPNVQLSDGWPASSPSANRIVVIDCPPLTEPSAQRFLQGATAVLLTCLVDVLCWRTLPSATRAIQAARETTPELQFLGIIPTQVDVQEPMQVQLLQHLRLTQPELLLEPPIPLDPALRSWPLTPGGELPECTAASAYEVLAGRITRMVETTPTPFSVPSPMVSR
ncbi:MAG: AAA family ATPase [Gemmataceae bacterium]|nr:AAA family ATPase [Gemmataceae bacterium]